MCKACPGRSWSRRCLNLLLGGILGTLGQGLRVVAGLKKMNDQAARDRKTFSDMFQTSAMLSSLMIGFIAGAVAIVVSIDVAAVGKEIDKTTIVTLITAGYAGTDFIEGFIRKHLPGGGGGGGDAPPEAPAPAAPAVTDEPAVG